MGALDVLARVPGILSRAFGQGAVEWRATIGSGSYASFAEAHQGPTVEVLVFNDRTNKEVKQAECTLTVPYTASALAAGYQVRTSDGLEWAVAAVRPNAQHGLRQYTLRRDPLQRITPDRGATP